MTGEFPVINRNDWSVGFFQAGNRSGHLHLLGRPVVQIPQCVYSSVAGNVAHQAALLQAVNSAGNGLLVHAYFLLDYCQGSGNALRPVFLIKHVEPPVKERLLGSSEGAGFVEGVELLVQLEKTHLPRGRILPGCHQGGVVGLGLAGGTGRRGRSDERRSWGGCLGWVGRRNVGSVHFRLSLNRLVGSRRSDLHQVGMLGSLVMCAHNGAFFWGLAGHRKSGNLIWDELRGFRKHQAPGCAWYLLSLQWGAAARNMGGEVLAGLSHRLRYAAAEAGTAGCSIPTAFSQASVSSWSAVRPLQTFLMYDPPLMVSRPGLTSRATSMYLFLSLPVSFTCPVRMWSSVAEGL